MAVRDGRGDVKQTTTGFRDPRHHICQKQIPIPLISLKLNKFNLRVVWRRIEVRIKKVPAGRTSVA